MSAHLHRCLRINGRDGDKQRNAWPASNLSYKSKRNVGSSHRTRERQHPQRLRLSRQQRRMLLPRPLITLKRNQYYTRRHRSHRLQAIRKRRRRTSIHMPRQLIRALALEESRETRLGGLIHSNKYKRKARKKEHLFYLFYCIIVLLRLENLHHHSIFLSLDPYRAVFSLPPPSFFLLMCIYARDRLLTLHFRPFNSHHLVSGRHFITQCYPTACTMRKEIFLFFFFLSFG